MAGEHYLEELRQIAEANGGSLLSTEWRGTAAKYRFSFADGREFQKSAAKLKGQGWPKDPDSYFRRVPMEYMQDQVYSTQARRKVTAFRNLTIAMEYAEQLGGEVLTTIDEYADAVRCVPSLRWRCSEGHEWMSSGPKLYSTARWCPTCKHGGKTTIDDLHAHARSRGGLCLSTKFKTGKDKYEWECGRGHKWVTSWFHIRFSNTWCPCCNNSIREQICRFVFEKVFGGEFPSRKPLWLEGLEMDGFNEAMNLAFEHHGQQHYKVDGYFIKTEEQLKRRQEDDATKLARCRANGVTLVEIPNLDLYGDHQRIISDILHACKQAGVSIPLTIPVIDLSPAFGDLLFHKLSNLVKENGGSLLNYSGTTNSAKFLCRCGYEWHAQPKHLSKLKYPGLCRRCIWTIEGLSNRHLEELRQIAEANGGKLLSTKWVGSNGKYSFAFNDGRTFSILVSNLKGRGWPKYPDKYLRKSAERAVLQLEELRRIAEAAGGQLLTTEWAGNAAKYRFAFADGREFEMSAKKITQRGWPSDPDLYLRRCGNRGAIQMERLRSIAEANGGKLLSTEWMGNSTQYQFMFADGRTFSTIASNLMRRGWPDDPDKYLRRGVDREDIHLEDLRRIAELNGGKLLSHEWKGVHVRHRFAFADGREFETTPASILGKQGWPKDPNRYLKRIDTLTKKQTPEARP